MRRVVAVDLDQTLLHTLHRFHRAFNWALLRRGMRPLTYDHFLMDYAADRLDLYRGCEDRHSFWRDVLSGLGRPQPEDALIEGSSEFLELVSSECPVYLTTGRIVERDLLLEELERFGIAEFFTDIYTRDPHRMDMFRYRALRDISRREGVDGHILLLVGDYHEDMREGKAAGATAIGVLTGLMPPDVLYRSGADVVVESVAHITPDLLGL